MLKTLLEIIGGKQANIFNKKGKVQHDLGSKKWEDWNNRLKTNPDYDWKKHSGKQGPKGPTKPKSSH